FSLVNGNYGFGDMCPPAANGDSTFPCDDSQKVSLDPGDYIVKVEIPDDARGKPKYKVVKEEDINVFTGDSFRPQIPPPPCVGSLHTVDVAGMGSDGPNAVVNPGFVDAGGSPFEGQQKPL